AFRGPLRLPLREEERRLGGLLPSGGSGSAGGALGVCDVHPTTAQPECHGSTTESTTDSHPQRKGWLAAPNDMAYAAQSEERLVMAKRAYNRDRSHSGA